MQQDDDDGDGGEYPFVFPNEHIIGSFAPRRRRRRLHPDARIGQQDARPTRSFPSLLIHAAFDPLHLCLHVRTYDASSGRQMSHAGIGGEDDAIAGRRNNNWNWKRPLPLAPLPPPLEKEGEVRESPWTLSPSRILHDVPMRSMLACVALSPACMFGDQEKSEGGHLSQSLSCPLPIRPTSAPFPSFLRVAYFSNLCK